MDAFAIDPLVPNCSNSGASRVIGSKCGTLASGAAAKAAIAAVPRPLIRRSSVEKLACAVPEGLALNSRQHLSKTCPSSTVSDELGSPKKSTDDVFTDEPVTDVSELHALLLREVTRLNGRVQQVEEELDSTKTQAASLESQLNKMAEVSRRDAVQRLELAANFARALQEERAARQEETAFLRAALATEADKAATQAANAVAVAEAACAAVARADAQGLADMNQRFCESLQQQHAQVALDVAERHMEAARALDARATEVAELVESVQRQASGFKASLTKEVADVVCPILEEHLQWVSAPSSPQLHDEENSSAILMQPPDDEDTFQTALAVDSGEDEFGVVEPRQRRGSVRAQIADVEERAARAKCAVR